MALDTTQISTQIASLQSTIAGYNTRISALEQGSDNAKGRLDGLNLSIANAQTTLSGYNTRITALESSKPDLSVISKLESDMSSIQTALAAISTDLSALEKK